MAGVLPAHYVTAMSLVPGGCRPMRPDGSVDLDAVRLSALLHDLAKVVEYQWHGRIAMAPLSGSSRINASAVMLLPQPDSPTSAKVSPRSMHSDRPSIARTRPASASIATLRSVTFIIADQPALAEAGGGLVSEYLAFEVGRGQGRALALQSAGVGFQRGALGRQLGLGLGGDLLHAGGECLADGRFTQSAVVGEGAVAGDRRARRRIGGRSGRGRGGERNGRRGGSSGRGEGCAGGGAEQQGGGRENTLGVHCVCSC